MGSVYHRGLKRKDAPREGMYSKQMMYLKMTLPIIILNGTTGKLPWLYFAPVCVWYIYISIFVCTVCSPYNQNVTYGGYKLEDADPLCTEIENDLTAASQNCIRPDFTLTLILTLSADPFVCKHLRFSCTHVHLYAHIWSFSLLLPPQRLLPPHHISARATFISNITFQIFGFSLVSHELISPCTTHLKFIFMFSI